MQSYSSSINLSRASSVFSVNSNDYAKLPDSSLDEALKAIDNILHSQTKAIGNLTSQYQKSEWSISQMKSSLITLNSCLNRGGKIIISGMGKSFKIAMKTVATLNSLGLHSASLHPSEALHGDLGMIREDHNDCLIIISASGNSPELALMLNYIPLSTPVILMTCCKDSSLAQHARVSSILYAELPSYLAEKNLYGLSAPTISTTLCLTLLDAVSIALSELNIGDLSMRKMIFGTRHPGGAIGINFQNDASAKDEVINQSENTIASSEANIADELNLESLSLAHKLDYGDAIELEELPTDELSFLKIITCNTHLVVNNNDNNEKFFIVSEEAKKLYCDSQVAGIEFATMLCKLDELKKQIIA